MGFNGLWVFLVHEFSGTSPRVYLSLVLPSIFMQQLLHVLSSFFLFSSTALFFYASFYLFSFSFSFSLLLYFLCFPFFSSFFFLCNFSLFLFFYFPGCFLPVAFASDLIVPLDFSYSSHWHLWPYCNVIFLFLPWDFLLTSSWLIS
jgi:hypothetical protein